MVVWPKRERLWLMSDILCDLPPFTTLMWLRTKLSEKPGALRSSSRVYYGWAASDKGAVRVRVREKKACDSLIGRISHDIQIFGVSQPMGEVCSYRWLPTASYRSRAQLAWHISLLLYLPSQQTKSRSSGILCLPVQLLKISPIGIFFFFLGTLELCHI